MTSLREQIIQKHIEDNYPNSNIVNYDNASESGLTYYKYNELNNVNEHWFPLCCFKDKETGELIYGGRNKIYHTYVEGETGCGKTTRVLIQTLNALANLRERGSFLVIDPFGEIYHNTYQNFKKRGYKIKVLNCDEADKSDTYNPFTQISRKCLETKELTDEVLNRIRVISEIIQPVVTEKDPLWEIGARAYLNGLILDCYEDLVEGKLPIESISIYNIIQRHYWLRKLMTSENERDILKIDHYKKKSSKALSVQKLMGVTNNADTTRDCYWGIIENRLDVFGQKSMYKLSTSNTIDVEEFVQDPTVIFIQSGVSKIGNDLVSLLINDIYETALSMGKKNRINHNIHCFLDEFTNYNYGTGEQFVQMLTTSRKFKMFWHMYLQCDAQVDKKFDNDLAATIRGNTTEIFMGSQDYSTLSRFSEACGKKTIESLRGKIYQNDVSVETVNLIDCEKLRRIPEGNMYIVVNKQRLLYSYFEAFYNCDEFKQIENLEEIYPINDYLYEKTFCTPDQYGKILNSLESKLFSMNDKKMDDKYFDLVNNLKWVKTTDGKTILVVDVEEKDMKKFDGFPEDEFIYDIDKLKVYQKKKKIFDLDNFDEWFETIDLTFKIEDMKKYDCIPNDMIETIENGKFDMNKIPHKAYVISSVEQFIVRNRLKNKNQYLDAYKNELEKMQKISLLPKKLMQVFTDAYEYLKSLSPKEIATIKKITNE